MFLLAKTKKTIDKNGKSGSIPFSGMEIPPDKLSSQKTSNPINKAFIKMLMVFNMICLFLFLKLKILRMPKTPTMKHKMLIIGMLESSSSTSKEVTYRKREAKTANAVHIV